MTAIDLGPCRALVAEARASTDGVTEGPWRVDSAPDYGVEVCCISADDVEIVVTDSGTYPPSMKDAAFIAKSRTLLPQLADAYDVALDELEQLRARVAKLQAVVAKLDRCWRCSKAATLCYAGVDDLTCDDCDTGFRGPKNFSGPYPDFGCQLDLSYAAALRALEEP